MISFGNYYTHDGKRRLMDRYIIPAIKAFGIVMSSDSGREIFWTLERECRWFNQISCDRDLAERDYATRRQERVAESYGRSDGKISALRYALSVMVASASDGAISQDTALRYVNTELRIVAASRF